MLPVLLICSGLPYLGNVWAKRAKKDSSNNLQVIQTFLFGFFRAPTPKQTDYFPLRFEPIIIRPPFCLLCNIELIQYWQNYYWFWSSSASLSFFIGPWTLGPDLWALIWHLEVEFATDPSCVTWQKQIYFQLSTDSFIGDFVTDSLTEPRDPRDLWRLRHLIRVMRRHDRTKKKTMTTTKTMTKTNTFREHLQWVILETCDLWDIWSEWWGDMTQPKKNNDKDKDKDNDKDKYI